MVHSPHDLQQWEIMNTPSGIESNGRFAAIGIDIGSTTAKIVVFCDGKLVYSCYERHFS
jgi:activator of 2-hydroxyglutaryl-CoA dehydratase